MASWEDISLQRLSGAEGKLPSPLLPQRLPRGAQPGCLGTPFGDLRPPRRPASTRENGSWALL